MDNRKNFAKQCAKYAIDAKSGDWFRLTREWEGFKPGHRFMLDCIERGYFFMYAEAPSNAKEHFIFLATPFQMSIRFESVAVNPGNL